jgi:hypothetical protein
MNATFDWRHSWDRFVDEVQTRLDAGSTGPDLASFFAGETIYWEGIIDNMLLDDEAPGVGILMPIRSITSSDRTQVQLSGVSISVDSCNVPQWSRFSIGDAVGFTANFSGPRAVFPCCQLIPLPSGLTVFIIALEGALPVS